MSSRILRRFQEDDVKQKNNSELSETNEIVTSSCEGTVKHKNLPVNLFEVLNKTTESSSDFELEQNEQTCETRRKRKKKKKKRGNKTNVASTCGNSDIEEECDNDFQLNLNKLCIENTSKKTDTENVLHPNNSLNNSSVINIKLHNLNPNNELKRIFGASVVRKNGRVKHGSRIQMKTLWLTNLKEKWPPLVRSGISMKVERKNGYCMFYYEHDQEYQKTEKNFLKAIRSLSAEKIKSIVKYHPYHVNALIQLSDIYKASENFQAAADLNERALHCLEFAFHPCFKMDKNCRLDYRRQVNRALFVCLFKHLTFVGERACYRTSLELCKLLLSFDFDLDPLAVILCIDFYALRSREYLWLISAAQEWESKKNLSQLPNFAFSTALAHFYLSEENKTDLSTADKMLQDALILFPGTLIMLFDKCNVQCDATVSQHSFFTLHVNLDHSPALKKLISLYVCRTFHEWKVPRVMAWLEANVLQVLERINMGDPYVTECMQKRRTNYTYLPRNVLRHLVLSDIEDVMTGIGVTSRVAILTFDPVPPIDSIDIYTNTELERNISQSQNLTSLFFRSLLPNFGVYNREAEDNAQGNNAVAEIGLVLEESPGSLVEDTVRFGVSMIMAAVESVVTDIANRVEARMDAEEEHSSSEGSENDSDEESEDTYAQDAVNS